MNRLTYRLEDGWSVMDCKNCELGNSKKCTTLGCRDRLKNILASYEDTGYTPEQIKHLEDNLAQQTAFAQNTASALDTNKQLVEKLNAAVEVIRQLVSAAGESCSYCGNYIKCDGKACEHYIEGVGCTDESGKYWDWKWSCRDFEYGTCAKLENTPCNGCFKNDDAGFVWNEKCT